MKLRDDEDGLRDWLNHPSTLSRRAGETINGLTRRFRDLSAPARYGASGVSLLAIGSALIVGTEYVTGDWFTAQFILSFLSMLLTGGAGYTIYRICREGPYRSSEPQNTGLAATVVAMIILPFVLLGTTITFPAHNDYYQVENELIPHVKQYRAALIEAREANESTNLGNLVANGRLPASACDSELVRHDETISCGIGADRQFTVEAGDEDYTLSFQETDNGTLMRVGQMERSDYEILKQNLPLEDDPNLEPVRYHDAGAYFRLSEGEEALQAELDFTIDAHARAAAFFEAARKAVRKARKTDGVSVREAVAEAFEAAQKQAAPLP